MIDELAVPRLPDDRPGCGCIGTGLVLMFGLAILIVVAVQQLAPERDSTGALTEGGRLGVAAVQVGDCVTYDSLPSEVVGFDVLPCSAPHRAQVIAVGSLLPGPWPGDDQLVARVERRCAQAMADKAEAGVDLSRFDLVTLRPLARNWVADRGYTCLVVSATGDTLTGDALVAEGA